VAIWQVYSFLVSHLNKYCSSGTTDWFFVLDLSLMSFTYPFFLWGLLALAIPIIIHLFNFRKARKVQFSNVRILETIKKKSASNHRLRHLFVLLSRLLFVFFLVLTFAQPFVPSQQDGLQSNSVVLYIDNSYSMSNLTDSDISGFNQALTIAEQIVKLYPEETLFKLYTNNLKPDSNQSRTKTKTLDKLTEVEYAPTTRSGKEIFSFLKKVNTGEKADVFVLSDFQTATIGQISNITDSINNYHLIPITFPTQSNVYVDTIYLNNPFLIPNQKNSIHLRLKNISDDPINDLSVKLFIDDQRNATASMDLDAHAVKEIEFGIPANLNPMSSCRFSFEDFPIVFDNDYYFTLNQISKIKIVEINDAKEKSSTYKVFEDNPLFDITTFTSGDISYQSVDKAELLIFNNLSEISNGLLAQLKQQLQKGKSAIFIPSSMQTPLDNLGISMYKIEDENDTLKIPLKVPDINNPFFENIFESITEDTKLPNTAVVYHWNENDIPLLQTKTGKSFLSQIPSLGNFFLFSSALNESYTNFHKHALFVPILQRIAEQSGSTSQSLANSINQPNLTIQVDSIPLNQLYKLKMKDQELIPSQRLNNNQLILNVPKYLIQPGHYNLKLGESTINVISFNHAKEESELTVLSMDELVSKLSGISILNIFDEVDTDSFSSNMKEKYHSRELWKYALILSLIFLFIESVLLRFL
jgi:hypothetical protein